MRQTNKINKGQLCLVISIILVSWFFKLNILSLLLLINIWYGKELKINELLKFYFLGFIIDLIIPLSFGYNILFISLYTLLNSLLTYFFNPPIYHKPLIEHILWAFTLIASTAIINVSYTLPIFNFSHFITKIILYYLGSWAIISLCRKLR